MSASAIYRGELAHTRSAPRVHAFRMKVFMLYLDLDELPGLFDGVPLWSARRPAVAWFRRQDFLRGVAEPGTPLADAARDLVAARTGERPTGAVRVLTHLRYFGYQINPIRIYYCFNAAHAAGGERLAALIAEVTNTPWGAVHHYVLPVPATAGQAPAHLSFEKALHVSPFMPMDQHYDWEVSAPGALLRTTLRCVREGSAYFAATLHLRRSPATRGGLLRALLRQPWMTARVAVGIYAHATRLYFKGVPFHAYPKNDKPPKVSHP